MTNKQPINIDHHGLTSINGFRRNPCHSALSRNTAMNARFNAPQAPFSHAPIKDASFEIRLDKHKMEQHFAILQRMLQDRERKRDEGEVYNSSLVAEIAALKWALTELSRESHSIAV